MSFKKGLNGNVVTFPFTQTTIDNLVESKLASPRVGSTHNIKVPDYFDIDESLIEVQQVRMEVEKGIFPRWFFEKYYPFEGEFPEVMPKALIMERLTFGNPKGLADVVHMDLPTDMPFAVHQWLLSEGVKVNGHNDNYVNFLSSVPDVMDGITSGVKQALDKAFEVKYYYGLDRPEEKFEEKTGISPVLLTHYPEGCPTHPSFVAGHGAASGGGVKALLDQYDNLTDEQVKACLDIAYIWAMNRTLAGVHYAIDNVGGLIIGGLGSYMRDEVTSEYAI